MLGRTRKPPILARVPRREDQERRPGTLDRAELSAYTELLAALADSRVVLVTGEEWRHGIALGVASAAVAAGRQTILAECDLARPRLATVLGMEASPGLAEFLRRQAQAAELLESFVLAGPGADRAVAPLVCVPAGAAGPDADDLLASSDFGAAAAQLRRSYELVVLSGPSAAEERSLSAAAAYADSTVACVSSARLPRRARRLVDGLVLAETA